MVRVTVTRIEWDGTVRRRMVDTAHRRDGPQWKTSPAARWPSCRSTGRSPEPVYHICVDDTVVRGAEQDLAWALLDLITAVLALG
jgi:hypothetical protein